MTAVARKRRWASYEDYLASESWKAARKRALIYADYRCQVCNGAQGLEVHHRCYDRGWGEEHPADLTVLCRGCHSLFHEREQEQPKKEQLWAYGEVMVRVWGNLLEAIQRQEDGLMLKAMLSTAAPSGLRGNTLHIVFPASAAFSYRKVRTPANREKVLKALRGMSRGEIAVEFELETAKTE